MALACASASRNLIGRLSPHSRLDATIDLFGDFRARGRECTAQAFPSSRVPAKKAGTKSALWNPLGSAARANRRRNGLLGWF